VSSTLSAKIEGEMVDRCLKDGLLESERIATVLIPAEIDAGEKSAVVTFHWPDDIRTDHRIVWRAVPPIEATPRGLIVSDDTREAVRTVKLTSISGPFRILRVSNGATAGGLPSDSKTQHTIELTLDPASLREPSVRDILIGTDHPHQPDVVLSVLMLRK
jgi:hypothetical protein